MENLTIDTKEFDRDIQDAIRFFKELPGRLDETVHQDAMMAAARVVAAEARRRVPIRTGALRDSIRVRRSPKKYRPGAMVIASGSKKAGTKGYHAKLVEYGTVKTPAQPYMESAARARSKQIRAAAKAINKSFNRVVKELIGGKKPTRRTRRALAAD